MERTCDLLVLLIRKGGKPKAWGGMNCQWLQSACLLPPLVSSFYGKTDGRLSMHVRHQNSQQQTCCLSNRLSVGLPLYPSVHPSTMLWHVKYSPVFLIIHNKSNTFLAISMIFVRFACNLFLVPLLCPFRLIFCFVAVLIHNIALPTAGDNMYATIGEISKYFYCYFTNICKICVWFLLQVICGGFLGRR